MASTQSPKPRQATALIILSLVVIFLSSAIVEAAPPFVLPADAPINIKTQAALSRKTSSNKHERDGDGSQILKGTNKRPIRVCYQGEPGAYSEKSLRELLGSNVIAVPRPDFESCYRAVASKECDYACLPVENSLGGSIHDNYDLQLKYDLTIVAEHECRVSHCLHAMPGVKKSDIKYCMSHPQALAQCDNYLSGLGIKPVPMYDTAGSAKLLRDNAIAAKSPSDKKPSRALPDKCTLENTAAIASDLAGTTYQLNCLDKKIEDDDTNFTRFLLLGRSERVTVSQQGCASQNFSCIHPPEYSGGALQSASLFFLEGN
jgi:prephenate dehydratase